MHALCVYMWDERHLSTAGFSSSLIDSALKLFKHFPPAMAVRFITRRFIGEYDPTLGRYRLLESAKAEDVADG